MTKNQLIELISEELEEAYNALSHTTEVLATNHLGKAQGMLRALWTEERNEQA
jgi:methylthioribose-1-phosphate isomerase